jgi:hypothetical protein
MAPKNIPMPKSASIKSPLDAGYEVAMENLWQGMRKAAVQGLFSPTNPQDNFATFKRISRMLMSQGDNFLVDYFNNTDPETLTDPEIAKKIATTISNKLGGDAAQKAMNFAPGIIEGHHGISVDSTFAASKHLSMKDRLEFHRILNNEYLAGGTVPEDMFPLTRFAHQGYGSLSGKEFPQFNAHAEANPLKLANAKNWPTNTGTWSREFDFSSIKDPRKLATTFMEQSGYPQIMMAEQAFDSAPEVAFRSELAQKLGIRERDLYSLNKDFSTKGTEIKQRIKDAGIDVNEIAHRAYGLQYRPKPPKDPNAPKVAKTIKPKVAPTLEDAAQFAKGWFDEADFLPTQSIVKPLAAAAGFLPGVGAILDVGDVSAGTQQVMGSQSKPQQVVGGLRAASGALGLASLAAPVLAPAALAISGVSALADRRLAADTANKPDVSVSGKPARVIPTRQMPPSKPIGTGQGGVTKPKGAMPTTKPVDLVNEAQYFIVNPIRSAYDRIFGKRDI